jgi:hypothetical protein
MKGTFSWVVAAMLTAGLARAGETLAEASPPRSLNAKYVIYSGDFGEQYAPTKTDRKLSIVVTGQPAKEIFDSLSPDIRAECTAEPGERQRMKEHIWCIYGPRNGDTCYFGFDLRTGKSIDGGEC